MDQNVRSNLLWASSFLTLPLPGKVRLLLFYQPPPPPPPPPPPEEPPPPEPEKPPGADDAAGTLAAMPRSSPWVTSPMLPGLCQSQLLP
jgi:hypothetical protein